ncbi:AFG1/ZapE family ATPase, partial [Acinetobacter baumannii]
AREAKPDPVPGLYMFGGVGRGKSMLMDLFYESVAINRKVRVQFHEFMQDIHARLRVERDKMQGDPIPPVARQFSDNYRLIAFDEM